MRLRNSTLAKYIISYILVLAVAFVGFYAVVRFHLQREYKSVYQTETEDKIQNMTRPNAVKDMEQQEFSLIAGGNTKWYSYFRRQSGGFSEN